MHPKYGEQQHGYTGGGAAADNANDNEDAETEDTCNANYNYKETRKACRWLIYAKAHFYYEVNGRHQKMG